MKFSSIAAAALVFALPAFAQTTESVSCDKTYNDAPLADRCRMLEWSSRAHDQRVYYPRFTPNLPFTGGAYTVTGWNPPACGTCYNITYSPTGVTITVLAVDVALDGFDLSEEAMNASTDGNAIEFGRINTTAAQVDASLCGLWVKSITSRLQVRQACLVIYPEKVSMDVSGS